MNYRGEQFIKNGAITSITEIDAIVIESGRSIYEVVRIYNKHIAFLPEHWKRMQQSAELSHITIPGINVLNQSLNKLISLTKIENGNLEIVVNSHLDWSIRFIPHSYPTSEQYAKGIATKTYAAIRENPNAKVKALKLRELVGRFIEHNNIYEAIYTHNDLIHEGSRTNIFFIKDNTLYTPLASTVLPGITRQVVIKLINNNSFHLSENPIQVKQLSDFDSVFLTGTSPEILPVKCIDDTVYNVENKILRHLMEQYSTIVSQNYINH